MSRVPFQYTKLQMTPGSLEDHIPKRRIRKYQIPAVIVIVIGIFMVFIIGSFYCGSSSQMQMKPNLTSSEDELLLSRFYTSFCKGQIDDTCTNLLIVFVFGGEVMTELSYLCVLFVEELHHKKQRHENSIMKTLLFVGKDREFLVKFLSSSVLIMYCKLYGSINFVFLIILRLMVGFSLRNFKEPSALERSELAESLDLNMGRDFAIWYCLGYLKLLLSSTLNKPSWKDRLREYEGKNQPLTVKKLFILFPTSCLLHGNLADIDFKEKNKYGITEVQKPKELVIKSAGIVNRSFRNTVYEIRYKEKTYRCAIEYATPIKTLNYLNDKGSEYLCLSPVEKEDQVRLFYREVKSLVCNDPDCEDNIELVLIEDSREKDKAVVLIEAVIQRIEELSS